jgi:pimeloyl-ACP methyl ester carboxylesterase
MAGSEAPERRCTVQSIEIREAGVFGVLALPDGPGPFPGVVGLSGSGGGIPSWWGNLLAPHGIAVLAAAYFAVDPLPPMCCEIPLETVADAAEWLRQRPEVNDGRVGLIGASKGAEMGLLAAAAFPDLIGPVAAISPQSVAWFGIDPALKDWTVLERSSWTLDGKPVPFVRPVAGVGFDRSERGISSVRSYKAHLEQRDAVAAATIPVERVTGPLLLLSGGQDALSPSTTMAQSLVDRMRAHGRAADVRHLNFPECGHVIVRPWPAGQAPPTAFDYGGTVQALDAAHNVALPEVVQHLRGSS